MKKIILILFLFLLCFSCYIIYNLTNKKPLYITSIGDDISNIMYLKNYKNNLIYNTDYTNNECRIIDLLEIIKNNEPANDKEEQILIHRVLKKTDILIISIGMNDLYYKINDNSKEIYTYLNNIINDYQNILKIISKYDYQKVYVLGYYNITNENNDIFTYINYKLKKVTEEYHYNYIDLNSIFHNREEYLIKSNDFQLNKEGKSQIYKLIVENLKKC